MDQRASKEWFPPPRYFLLPFAMGVALMAVMDNETVSCMEQSYIVVPPTLERIGSKLSRWDITKRETIIESGALTARSKIFSNKIIKALNKSLHMKKSTTSSTSHLTDMEWKIVVIYTEEGVNAICVRDCLHSDRLDPDRQMGPHALNTI